MRVNQPTIKSRNDLAFVSGQLNGYNFYDGTRGTHIYTFKIVGYESHFHIAAEFLGFFDKAGFESIDPKEDLSVGIFKQDTAKLSIPGKTVFVYAIATGTWCGDIDLQFFNNPCCVKNSKKRSVQPSEGRFCFLRPNPWPPFA